MVASTGETEVISLNKAGIRVYPNPTRGDITLWVDGIDADQPFVAEISDLTGKRVLEASMRGPGKHSISLTGRAGGVYILRVISDSFMKTCKVIKQ